MTFAVGGCGLWVVGCKKQAPKASVILRLRACSPPLRMTSIRQAWIEIATRLPPLMKKHDRMTAFVASLDTDPALAANPCYQGYFRCFNDGLYYEAHDVLEHLWLGNGRDDANHAFYKGLIQVAGAFVHLRKQYEHPAHAKHGRRLRPAVRLFALAQANLTPYGPRHPRPGRECAAGFVRASGRGDCGLGFHAQSVVAGFSPATRAGAGDANVTKTEWMIGAFCAGNGDFYSDRIKLHARAEKQSVGAERCASKNFPSFVEADALVFMAHQRVFSTVGTASANGVSHQAGQHAPTFSD